MMSSGFSSDSFRTKFEIASQNKVFTNSSLSSVQSYKKSGNIAKNTSSS